MGAPPSVANRMRLITMYYRCSRSGGIPGNPVWEIKKLRDTPKKSVHDLVMAGKTHCTGLSESGQGETKSLNGLDESGQGETESFTGLDESGKGVLKW